MLGTAAFVDFVLEWWPPLDATEVLAGCATPRCWRGSAEGVLSTDEQALLSKSWGPVQEPAAYRVTPDDWSVEDVALLDELRYELGDVPERPAGDRDTEYDPVAELFDENVPELTTVGDRTPHGSAADGAHRGRRLRPRARRRGAGPHADAVADGRPARPRPRPGPSSATRRSRRGRSRRTPAGPARRRSATSRATTSTCRRTTATARRSTTSRPRTPRGWVSTPTCPTPCARPASTRSSARSSTWRAGRPRGRHRDWPAPSRAPSASSCRSPAARRCRAGSTAGATSRATPPAAALARIAVLTGVETKGLEFDGIVVVAPDEIEAESVTGRSDALRRAHPRHPAHGVASPPDRRCPLDAEARGSTPGTCRGAWF